MAEQQPVKLDSADRRMRSILLTGAARAYGYRPVNDWDDDEAPPTERRETVRAAADQPARRSVDGEQEHS
jgi:hypothetical protein